MGAGHFTATFLFLSMDNTWNHDPRVGDSSPSSATDWREVRELYPESPGFWGTIREVGPRRMRGLHRYATQAPLPQGRAPAGIFGSPHDNSNPTVAGPNSIPSYQNAFLSFAS